MNYLYLDTETTGLDPLRHSIVQLSGIIKVGSKEVSFNFKMKPYHNEEVDPYATQITGLTTEEVYSWEDPSEVFRQFVELLDSFNITYSTKFNLVGYNVGFDDEFVREWFKLNGKNWGYYVWFPYIDVMSLANIYFIQSRHLIKNFKLGTIYKEIFGKEFANAHDAFFDIIATKELFEFISKRLSLPLDCYKDNTKEEPKIKVRPRRIAV